MSVLFNHAIRHEWLEQGKNPILLVRQSAKRQRIPEWLEPEELSALLSQLDRCFRVMVFLDAATGLRRSELLALKWGDIEFENLQIIVQRSIYGNVVGNCKTEASKKPVPMDPILAAELWAWKQDSTYSHPYDWVFASPRTKGKNPYWPDSILSSVIRPALARAGIQKHIGWHTFRHSFSTILIGNGENVKVVQELMRHSNCRCTLEIYSQARIQAKRDAQHRVIQMIVPWKEGPPKRKNHDSCPRHGYRADFPKGHIWPMTAAALLPWARTDRLQQLHSLFWLLCVFSNLGNLLFA